MSSIQNDAVRNAVDKLRRARSEDGGAAPEISVYHLPKQKERAAFAERMAEDGQSAALALRQASQGDPQLATYQALQELSDDLLQLEQDLLELDEQSAQRCRDPPSTGAERA